MRSFLFASLATLAIFSASSVSAMSEDSAASLNRTVATAITHPGVTQCSSDDFCVVSYKGQMFYAKKPSQSSAILTAAIGQMAAAMTMSGLATVFVSNIARQRCADKCATATVSDD